MKENRIAVLYSLLENNKENYYDNVDSVENALEKKGFDVWQIPVGKDLRAVAAGIQKISPKCIFNLCEEVRGNSWGEAYMAGVLELLGIPYTGSGAFSLGLSLNKARTKDVLRANGIKTPLYQVFHTKLDILSNGLKFPLIVKPLHEDGSYGIHLNSVVNSKNALYNRIKAIYKRFKEPAMVEEYINGRELNVSILGNGKNTKVLPISEIDYTTMPHKMPKICTYNAKWKIESKEYKHTVPVCPAPISNKIRKIIEDIAIRVYDIMGCRDYARIDIRLDKKEIPYIIEVNPNPCLSMDSGFARSAREAGLSYEDLIAKIVDICMERSCKMI